MKVVVNAVKRLFATTYYSISRQQAERHRDRYGPIQVDRLGRHFVINGEGVPLLVRMGTRPGRGGHPGGDNFDPEPAPKDMVLVWTIAMDELMARPFSRLGIRDTGSPFMVYHGVKAVPALGYIERHRYEQLRSRRQAIPWYSTRTERSAGGMRTREIFREISELDLDQQWY